jgi:hypothetical protein
LKIKFIILFILICTHILKADWVNVSNEINNLNINALTATDGYIFAGNDQYTYRSSNNGNNWQQIYNLSSLALASNGSYIYRGYQNGYNYSTNYGANWLFAGLNLKTISLLANGNYVYAGCSWPVPGSSTNRGVWISTNYGVNWSQTSLNNIDVYSLAISGSHLFAGGYNPGVAGGVFISTNNGQNWINPILGGGDALAANGSIVFAGGGSSFGVYKSTNYGVNWIQTSLNNVAIDAIIFYNNIVFAGGGSGFYVSIDSGTSWTLRNEGLTSGAHPLAIHDGYIFAGSSGQGVWRRPLSELVGINQISSEVPKYHSLAQNYPNPFNPVTKIKFNISSSSGGGKHTVKLVVFDFLGRELSTLFERHLNPGGYEVDFDGSNYSSGTYFYRLIADGNVIDTKKLVLIK